ncbi:dTDP-4-dehydrorhamnose 3,5-epimerase [Gammaproteobacteria bacterium]|jgi:dTDP-4-dehydrorhamnose 3,5-epimerase|nr:dTDP-4-dehydrorhamnose 3,5-epimerase [Gammaproteobacteria bacterium]
MQSGLLKGSHDLVYFEPKLYEDNRGYFFERFNKEAFFKNTGSNLQLFQSNESCSKKNVLRGLHYQLNKPQAKLVTVLQGIALDIVVDLRTNSSTFGQWFSIRLDSSLKNSLWIPRGYAHGFLSLSNNMIFSYMVDNSYDPASEQTLIWNDSSLKIDWGIEDPIISSKDAIGLTFNKAKKFDTLLAQ